ncbi:MAG: Npt1/Npt2 family nucleotide transporter [Myxococcota bacterium]
MPIADARAPSPLERFLGLFTEVRPGEAVTALLLTVNIFLLLTSYYIIKPVREGLILSLDGGTEYKSYLGGAIAAALFVVVPLYGRLVKRLPRNRLVVGVSLFFASHLAIFYALSTSPELRPRIAFAFYIWVGVFNMMVVAQFWSFANDIYDEEAGERLFALIGIGASGGAAIGSLVGSTLIPVFGVYQMLLLAAALLIACAGLFQWVHARETRRETTAPPPAPSASSAVEGAAKGVDKPKSDLGPYQMVARYRYLTLIAAFSLLFTLLNTNGEYILSSLVKARAVTLVGEGILTGEGQADWIAAWYGEFFLGVNVLGTLLQAFVVSRLVKLGGLKVTFLVYPVLALLDATMLTIAPLLLLARVGKTLENASDYSINNTARNMLWLPTTRSMKYTAKQAIDSFFTRLGDVMSALFVLLLAETLQLGVRYFAGANVIFAVATIVVALAIMRELPKIRAQRDRGELPGDDAPEAA